MGFRPESVVGYAGIRRHITSINGPEYSLTFQIFMYPITSVFRFFGQRSALREESGSNGPGDVACGVGAIVRDSPCKYGSASTKKS